VLNSRTGTGGASHRPPDRCAATSCADTPATTGNRPASAAVIAPSTARQSPDRDPDGTAGRAASDPDTPGSSRDSCGFPP
jgi:hypothetical protein